MGTSPYQHRANNPQPPVPEQPKMIPRFAFYGYLGLQGLAVFLMMIGMMIFPSSVKSWAFMVLGLWEVMVLELLVTVGLFFFERTHKDFYLRVMVITAIAGFMVMLWMIVGIDDNINMKVFSKSGVKKIDSAWMMVSVGTLFKIFASIAAAASFCLNKFM